jgi:hypothetical protein
LTYESLLALWSRSQTIKDQAKSNTEQNYQIQSAIKNRKTPKKRAVVGIMRRRRRRVWYMRRRRQILCSNRTPPRTATEAETWSTRAAHGVTNPLARADHVPVNSEFFDRSKQQQNRRTTAGKAGGRVSTRKWRNRADLELKE